MEKSTLKLGVRWGASSVDIKKGALKCVMTSGDVSFSYSSEDHREG